MRQGLALLTFISTLLMGDTVLAAVVAVSEPWLRPAAKGASTEAFMEVMVSEPSILIDVRAAAAAKVALVRGKERSAPPFALSLTAREPLRMEARGTHLVLSGVDRPLKRGDRVAFTLVLRFVDGTTQEVPVDAEVRRRSPSDDHGVHRH